jgi:outer membrane murein-binding lipoprotein Lpp
MEVAKQHGHCVVPTQYPQNQQLAHWAKCLRRESNKLFTTGSEVMFDYTIMADLLERVALIDSDRQEMRSRIVKLQMDRNDIKGKAGRSTRNNEMYRAEIEQLYMEVRYLRSQIGLLSTDREATRQFVKQYKHDINSRVESIHLDYQ